MRLILLSFLLMWFFSFNAFATHNSSTKIKAAQNPISKSSVNAGFADIIEPLLPAVVNISTIQDNSLSSRNNYPLNDLLPDNQSLQDFQKTKDSVSLGSGFVISKDGYIVTNVHVIDDAKEIVVSLADGLEYKARVVGVDKKTDLALLKISPVKDLKFVSFASPDRSRIGDWVIVVGNPFGFGGSVSVGIISAISRDIGSNQFDGLIQTDAAVNQGNSGGPMFNLKGEVIGVNSVIYSPSGNSVGIGFAIPANVASSVISDLKEQGEVSRAWIGLSVQDIDEEMADSFKIGRKGVFVTDVAEDGPAKKAGIVPSDIIVKFDDQEINNMKELPKIVAKTPINKLVKITIIRQGKTKVIPVKLTKLKDPDSKKSENKIINSQPISPHPSLRILGMGLALLDQNYKNNKNIDQNVEGLLVTDVAPKSIASSKSIMAGDIILSLNQTPLKSVEDFKKLVNKFKKITDKITLFIKRDNNNFAVILPIN